MACQRQENDGGSGDDCIGKVEPPNVKVVGGHEPTHPVGPELRRLQKGMGQYGCEHYRRRCRLVVPCCNDKVGNESRRTISSVWTPFHAAHCWPTCAPRCCRCIGAGTVTIVTQSNTNWSGTPCSEWSARSVTLNSQYNKCAKGVASGWVGSLALAGVQSGALAHSKALPSPCRRVLLQYMQVLRR
eukprot:scaffold7468_cov444-Prasinococcus_capsulatus_cf.AAC.4